MDCKNILEMFKGLIFAQRGYMEEVMRGEHEKCGNENVGITFDTCENNQRDAHFLSLIYSS